MRVIDPHCKRCHGTGRICEQHHELPFEHDGCPGPGAPYSVKAKPYTAARASHARSAQRR
jgi:hypothetical protein